MYPLGYRGWDAVCGVVLTPAHSDLHHAWFVDQDLSQSFTTYPPQVTQLRDPVMAFESCGLCAHSSVLNPITSFALDLRFPDLWGTADMEILDRIRFSVKSGPTPSLPAGPGVQSPGNSDLTEF